MRLNTVICLLFVLLSGASAHAAHINETMARKFMHLDVRGNFQSERFDQLDQMADEFRSTKSRYPDGGWKLAGFYAAFTLNISQPEWEFRSSINLAEKWRRNNPTSVTAQVVLAKLWHDYAWKARGNGYAKDIPEEAFQIFHNRIDLAWKIVNEPVSARVLDCPERYNFRLVLAKCLNYGDRKLFEELCKEAIQFEPEYYAIYFSVATYLLPRWGGEEGEWQEFITNVADKNIAGVGATIYARSAWYMTDYYKFSEMGISWDIMKSGFEQIIRNHPESPYLLNVFARFSCLAKDHSKLLTLYQSINMDNYNPTVWYDDKFSNYCRDMVMLPRFPQVRSNKGVIPKAYLRPSVKQGQSQRVAP